MSDHLGPLVLVDGAWLIGDPAARGGAHLRLEEQGIGRWEAGARAELVPWRRFMTVGLTVTPGRWGDSKLLAAVTDQVLALSGASRTGGGAATLSATLRQPYEYWSAEFTHHRRRYPGRECRLLGEFLKQTVESGAARSLGDRDRVAAVVDRLARLPSAPLRSAASQVRDALDG